MTNTNITAKALPSSQCARLKGKVNKFRVLLFLILLFYMYVMYGLIAKFFSRQYFPKSILFLVKCCFYAYT